MNLLRPRALTGAVIGALSVIVALSFATYTYGTTASVFTSIVPASAGQGDSVLITVTSNPGPVISITLGGTPVASFVTDTAIQFTAVVGGGSSGVVSIGLELF